MVNSKKENWLFIRGLARGQGHWGSFIPLFQKNHPEAEIECLDLPGNGLRHNELSPLKVADYMNDLRSHSKFVKEKKPFKVVALSLGAMITVEWMHQHPHEIEKAFLVCTSSARHSRFYQRLQLKNLRKGFSVLTSNTPEQWEAAILSMIVNNRQRGQEELPALIEFSRHHPVRLENILRQIAAASRYRFPRRPPGDVVLIGSWGDRLVSPQCTVQLAKAWNLLPQMHPSAGHDVPIDDPRWLIEHLL